MDETGRGFPPGDLRVSDADRDRALAELSEAFQVGRLTAGEFDQRSGQALRSRTGSELTGLLADLPPLALPQRAQMLGSGRPAPAVRRVVVGSTVAATVLAFSALAQAVRPGLTLAQREQLQAIARQPWSVDPASPEPGLRLARHGNTGGHRHPARRAGHLPAEGPASAAAPEQPGPRRPTGPSRSPAAPDRFNECGPLHNRLCRTSAFIETGQRSSTRSRSSDRRTNAAETSPRRGPRAASREVARATALTALRRPRGARREAEAEAPRRAGPRPRRRVRLA